MTCIHPEWLAGAIKTFRQAAKRIRAKREYANSLELKLEVKDRNALTKTTTIKINVLQWALLKWGALHVSKQWVDSSGNEGGCVELGLSPRHIPKIAQSIVALILGSG